MAKRESSYPRRKKAFAQCGMYHYAVSAALQTYLSSTFQRFADEIAVQALAELTIIGTVGVPNPPRPESAETVATGCRAGIRFFMVTGDFGLTGAAIARRIGIFF
jgi:P-type E1-E2 ATPase